MNLLRCIRPVDAAIGAPTLAVWAGLFAAGREGWMGASASIVIAVGLALFRDGP